MHYFLAVVYATCIITSSAFAKPFSVGPSSSDVLSASQVCNLERDIDGLKSWALDNKVQIQNGLELEENEGGDWSVSLSKNSEEDSPILQIPSHLVLASTKIKEELKDQVPPSVINFLEQRKVGHQLPQFYLWLKILKENDQGKDSQWYPWLQSLPRTFTNAIAMDDVEMECLAPFAWSLAKMQKIHLKYFREALEMIEGNEIMSEATKTDLDITQWAFSVVFTRAWWKDVEDNRTDIVPVGDMFNHDHPDNVRITYDDEGNCNVVLKKDVPTGTPLNLSYGLQTNPYRFMVLYGFFDAAQDSIFSQILVSKPSKKHVDMGYDTDKMAINTTDGTLSEENWDVTLFSILEQVPPIQEAFHKAHVANDDVTKKAIRKQFYMETCIMLKKHIDKTLMEMDALLQKIDEQDITQHPLLPMIRRSNTFVAQTFFKAKKRIDGMIKEEMAERKITEAKQESS